MKRVREVTIAGEVDMKKQSIGVVFLYMLICILMLTSKADAQNIGAGQSIETPLSHYYLLLDTSKSMLEPKGTTDNRIFRLKDSLTNSFLPSLQGNTVLHIITFDEGIQIRKEFVMKDESQKNASKAFIENLQVTGEKTFAWSSLKTVLNEAQNEFDGKNSVRVFMYTDGKDNQNLTTEDDVLASYEILKNKAKDQSGLQIFTLGFSFNDEVQDKFEGAGVGVLDVPDSGVMPTPESVFFRWWPDEPVAGEAVKFINDTIPSSNKSDSIWQFGDGTKEQLSSEPEHIFTEPGDYTVVLSNNSGTISRSISILPIEAPIAGFQIQTPQDAWRSGANIAFADKSTGKIERWVWDFGDGTSSEEQHASHVFTGDTRENFTITLTVKGPGGNHSISKDIAIAPSFIADFKLNRLEGQLPLAGRPFVVKATNLSKGKNLKFLWDFGDGSEVSHDKDPEHFFQNAGRYTVTLHVVDQETGETHSAPSQTVDVVPNHQVRDALIVESILSIIVLIIWIVWFSKIRTPSLKSEYNLAKPPLSKKRKITIGAGWKGANNLKHDIPLPIGGGVPADLAILEKASPVPELMVSQLSEDKCLIEADSDVQLSRPSFSHEKLTRRTTGSDRDISRTGMELNRGETLEVDGEPYDLLEGPRKELRLYQGYRLRPGRRGVSQLQIKRQDDEYIFGEAEGIEAISIKNGDKIICRSLGMTYLPIAFNNIKLATDVPVVRNFPYGLLILSVITLSAPALWLLWNIYH